MLPQNAKLLYENLYSKGATPSRREAIITALRYLDPIYNLPEDVYIQTNEILEGDAWNVKVYVCPENTGENSASKPETSSTEETKSI